MVGISKVVKEQLCKIGKVSLEPNWRFVGVRNVELKNGGDLDLYEFEATKDNQHFEALGGEPIALFERDLTADGNDANGFAFYSTKQALKRAVDRAIDRIKVMRERGEATR